MKAFVIRHGVEDGSKRVDPLGTGQPGIKAVDGRIPELFQGGERPFEVGLFEVRGRIDAGSDGAAAERGRERRQRWR